MEKIKKIGRIVIFPIELIGIAYFKYKIVRIMLSIMIIAILGMFGMVLHFQYGAPKLIVFLFGYIIYFLIEMWLKKQTE